MINDKDKDCLKSEFGSLMLKRVMLMEQLQYYEKELNEIDKNIQSKINNCLGVKEDGSTVQQKKSV